MSLLVFSDIDTLFAKLAVGLTMYLETSRPAEVEKIYAALYRILTNRGPQGGAAGMLPAAR